MPEHSVGDPGEAPGSATGVNDLEPPSRELEPGSYRQPAPPSRRALLLLVVPIAGLTVAALVANALAPALVREHPLMLIALEPRLRNFLAVAQKIDLVTFMVVAIGRRFLTDPCYFILGRWYGDGAIRWAERQMQGSSFVTTIERAFRRWSDAVVFFWPGALVCALAGATGMRLRRFLLLNIFGTIVTATAIRLFAELPPVEAAVEAVLRFNDRNFKWLTAITIALVVFWAVGSRGKKLGLEGLDELEAGGKKTPSDGDQPGS